MKLWQLYFLSVNMFVATNVPPIVGVILCIGWMILAVKSFKENI